MSPTTCFQRGDSSRYFHHLLDGENEKGYVCIYRVQERRAALYKEINMMIFIIREDIDPNIEIEIAMKIEIEIEIEIEIAIAIAIVCYLAGVLPPPASHFFDDFHTLSSFNTSTP